MQFELLQTFIDYERPLSNAQQRKKEVVGQPGALLEWIVLCLRSYERLCVSKRKSLRSRVRTYSEIQKQSYKACVTNTKISALFYAMILSRLCPKYSVIFKFHSFNTYTQAKEIFYWNSCRIKYLCYRNFCFLKNYLNFFFFVCVLKFHCAKPIF